MSEMLVNVDRDGLEFHISSEPVYGRFQVSMPQEFLWRFERAYDEWTDCQMEMRKYWEAAGNK